MKICRNNVDIRMSSKYLCYSCAFLRKQSLGCLLIVTHTHLPCGGEFTHTTSEIFTL